MTCVPGEENSCVMGGIYSTFNRKEALFTPSDSAPDIMRNGLQLLARHSLQHYTARVTVNPKSRDQDDDVKPERISRVIEHRYRVAERPSVKRAIVAESAV